jgi:hypothetical protein
MTKSIFILGTLCLFVCSFIAVNQKSHHNDAKIKMIAPTANQIFKKGDTIFIKSELTSSHAMHDVNSSIELEGHGVIFQDNLHTHNNNVTYEKSYVYNMKLKGNLVVKVYLKDHAGQISAIDSVLVKTK